MRVGIVTFHSSLNYGAILQAYALCSFLQNDGHEVQFINYDGIPQTNVDYKYKIKGVHPSDIMQMVKYKQFAKFRNAFLPATSRQYSSVDDVRDKLPDCDAFICGSDQIWNPELCRGRSLDPFFFLDFVPEDKLRISYAPSFGSSELPAEYLSTFKSHIQKLDHVSMRERAASDFVRDSAQCECETVLDPVFLLDSYEALLARKRYGKVCGESLCYLLQRNSEVLRVVEEYNKCNERKLYNIYGSAKFWSSPGRSVRPSPCGFVELMRNARILVTNSFHGVAFAMLMETDFVVLPRVGPTAKRSARIDELLSISGLSHRKAAGLSLESLLDADSKPIDWRAVASRLLPHKEASRKYLRNALSGGK